MKPEKLFRPNVAALVQCGEQFVACLRSKHPGWQCVQGGIEATDESPELAIIREMKEELGVEANDMRITFRSRYWRRYLFVKGAQGRPRDFIGQEQLWFVVRIESLSVINLKTACNEFTDIQPMAIGELVEKYVKWKHQPFFDFCRELQLI